MTPINSLPYTISSGGAYRLNTSVDTWNASTGIAGRSPAKPHMTYSIYPELIVGPGVTPTPNCTE